MLEPMKHEASPSSLIDRKQGGALVLGVICNHDAHEQGQADHTTQENVNMYVNRVNLEKKSYDKESEERHSAEKNKRIIIMYHVKIYILCKEYI